MAGGGEPQGGRPAEVAVATEDQDSHQWRSRTPRVRLASAAPSGGRTQGGRMAAPFGRPRTTPREVCAAPPGARGGYWIATKRGRIVESARCQAGSRCATE